MKDHPTVCSAESMIDAIRHFGIIPFFKSRIPGWSIEELTPPDHWFFSSDELGPWDWKVDVVRQGDIAYGKFLSRKTAFATVEYYRHLMNWRRSLQTYSIPVGGKVKGRTKTIDDKLNESMSPLLLSTIRERETMEYADIRKVLDEMVPEEVRKKIGGHMLKYLIPKVKKQAVDFLMQYLDMGTWTVVGDITRVYRGPNCEYSGWQRLSVTTPDLLFKAAPAGEAKAAPFWAKFIEEESSAEDLTLDCSPEESRDFLVSHICSFFPGFEDQVLKLI